VTLASVVAGAALLAAAIALLVAIRTTQRLKAMQADLASADSALEHERRARADSIERVHRETVEQVTTLLEHHLTQVDTETAARVAEALAHMDPTMTTG